MPAINDTVVITDQSSQFRGRQGTIERVSNNLYHINFDSGGSGDFQASAFNVISTAPEFPQDVDRIVRWTGLNYSHLMFGDPENDPAFDEITFDNNIAAVNLPVGVSAAEPKTVRYTIKLTYGGVRFGSIGGGRAACLQFRPQPPLNCIQLLSGDLWLTCSRK